MTKVRRESTMTRRECGGKVAFCDVRSREEISLLALARRGQSTDSVLRSSV